MISFNEVGNPLPIIVKGKPPVCAALAGDTDVNVNGVLIFVNED
jgi:hypothetical protein